jgi:rubrerythrin
MELEWARFYHKAAQSARDSSIWELLDRLADAEDEHESLTHKLAETILTKPACAEGGRDFAAPVRSTAVSAT